MGGGDGGGGDGLSATVSVSLTNAHMVYAPRVPSVTLIVKELSKTNSSIEDSSPSRKSTTLSPGRTAQPSTLTIVGLCSSTTEGVSCTLSDAAVGVALAAQSWEATGASAVSSRSLAAIRTTIPCARLETLVSVSLVLVGALRPYRAT